MTEVRDRVVFSAAWGGLLLLVMPVLAWPHSSLSDYIVHERSLVVGKEYIDVALSLTFLGQRAEAQRGKLDRDGDGAVSKEERALYLNSLTRVAEKQVRLSASGEPVKLRLLYSPKIEMVTDSDLMTVSIYLFGRRPDSLEAGGDVELAEGLYPRTPARFVHRVEGRDGVRVRLSGDTSGLVRSLEEKTAPKLRARILETEEE